MNRLNALAAAAAVSLVAATPAAAGGCCPLPAVNCACMPSDITGGIYLVNQGPVFSGPGHYLPRQPPDLPPSGYPYVGFVYSGYPYGLQNSGGYPRGSYSPYTGYPYAETYPGRPYVGVRRVAYRTSYRPARVYYRPVRPRGLHISK
jgi:hypothetical protein